jgi:uncharacterized protein YqgC (DUF456 family)
MVLSPWAFWAAVLFLIVGLLGVVLPAVPGVGFMWIVVIVYAVAEHFATIDPLTFTALTLLGVAGATADIWLAQLGAKVGGASLWSMVCSIVGGLLGGLVGLLFAGLGMIPGVLVGSILGVLVNEYRTHREWRAAWRASIGLMIGFTLSTVVQLVIGLAMIALFVWQVMRG